MAPINTIATESQVSTIHVKTRELVGLVSALVAQLQPSDALFSSFRTINTRLTDMVDQLRRAEARVVKSRLEAEVVAKQAEVAAQDALINAP